MLFSFEKGVASFSETTPIRFRHIPENSHSRAMHSLRFSTLRLPSSPTGRGRLRCQVQCCTLTKDEPGKTYRLEMKNTQQMLSGWRAALPGVQRGLFCVHRTPPALNLVKYNVVLDLVWRSLPGVRLRAASATGGARRRT